jgi:type IV pilus assembly protein PilV
MLVSRGFSLIEALVALAVLSLGLLGASAMLLGALRDQSLALNHQKAGILVADLAQRIRANARAGAAYATIVNPGSAKPCDEAAPCDAAELAAHDLAVAHAALRALLPVHARLAVSFEPAIGPAAADRFVILLSWQETRDPDSIERISLTLLAQPVAGAA